MTSSAQPKTGYRFGAFFVSPSRRLLLRAGEEVPLISRYFDLLVLLLDRRNEAVHRREILERVWSDVVVSDGALSQAVRTLRRALGDDSRNPAFIRTVSRHGYRFVHPGVVEVPDVPDRAAPPAVEPGLPGADAADPFDAPLARLLSVGPAGADDEEEERREAAEQLHALGTVEALRRLDERPGHARGRALLRDARWAVPGAAPVPLLGRPGSVRSILWLLRLRAKAAARLAAQRWTAAAAGGALAGAFGGGVGGVVLRLSPGADPLWVLPMTLAMVGAAIGGIGAAGAGAGLAAAEALARSLRGVALVCCGAAGGGAVGAAAHLLGGWVLEGVFGQDLSAVGGGFEGIVMGGAAGLGYALSTPRPGGGGMASPRGWFRLLAAGATGACCALAGVGLTWSGSRLGGVSLDLMARSFEGSHVSLAPLARLLGETGLGPVTRTVLGVYEGFLFGFGLALGLTRRPR